LECLTEVALQQQPPQQQQEQFEVDPKSAAGKPNLKSSGSAPFDYYAAHPGFQSSLLI
jgi:hypothetical protein